MPSAPRVAGRLVGGTALLLLLVWLLSLGLVLRTSRRDEAGPAQAIVVLGAAQYAGRPSPVLKARLDHALALWKRGLAPTIVLTGGRGTGDTTSEAQVGRNYVRKLGIPDTAILLETEGRTTSASMRGAAKLLRPRGATRVLLVSDPFHMRRLALIARRVGLEPYTSPTTRAPVTSSVRRNWKYLLAESVKVPLAFIIERETHQ
jgi:uncharacterized SAM-binding protein YcdF (DUF218 family)